MNRTETRLRRAEDPEGEDRPASAVSASCYPGSRRTYRPPVLECLGRLAEVTRFGGSDIVDSGGGLGAQP